MILYNAKMTVNEDGIGVWYDAWHSIYETKCFYMCLQDWEMTHFQGMSNEEIKAKCKSQSRKLKRIAKKYSRFAHTEKKFALSSLICRKKAQINHCKRNLAVATEFVNRVENRTDDFSDGNVTIEGTKEIVSEYYVFD